MRDYPNTVIEFQRSFATEQSCREYLYRMRWPNGFRCPRCDGEKAWAMSGGLYKCSKCKYRTSVTAGTIFQDTGKPLQVWFQAMWHVTNQKNGVSALGLQRALGLGSYRTAWRCLHKLRRAMVRPGRDRLSGTVEVDESFYGGPKPGKRGRGAAGKTLILIAAQKEGDHVGRIRLRRIRDASGNTLEKAVQEIVEPGSDVRTDGWRGYTGLKGLGYKHDVVRASPSVGDNLLPRVNQVVSLLKRWLLGTHQGRIQPAHLDYYLDEFTFRFNRRTSGSRGMLFYRLAQQAVAIAPVLGHDLIGGRATM